MLTRPSPTVTSKPVGVRAMAPTARPVQMLAPAARKSWVSMVTICVAGPSQNSWPRVFS